MQTIELGRTGQQVSQLALGAMQMGNATSESDSIRILDRYFEVGGSFVDTADCYEWWARKGGRGGDSEELLGRWLRDGNKRDQVFLATKGSALPHYSPDLVGRHLKETSSLAVVAASFALLLPICCIILWATGYFSLPLTRKNMLFSSGASSILGIMGTAVATILFYILIKRAGGLLASMVTYGIPFIALTWGRLAGERIVGWQIVGLVIILIGVYITTKKKQKQEVGRGKKKEVGNLK